MKVPHPKGALWKRLTKLFSVVTGISLGSTLIVFLLAILAIAIFVRTETFQTALKNRVLEIARKELQAEISYKTAELDIFSLTPGIDFHNIVFEQKSQNVRAEIQRFGLEISVFSLPLLGVNQLVLSKAEVQGLKYKVSDIASLREWFNELRPKTTVVPIRFQTSVKKISLLDVELTVDLQPDETIPRRTQGIFQIASFQVGLDSEQTDLSGLIQFDNVQVDSWGPYDGQLILDRAILEGKRLKFRNLRLSAGDDSLSFSGTILDLKNPLLDVTGETQIQLGTYLKDYDVGGYLKSDFKLQGPWKDLQGKGALSVKDFVWRKKSFENLKSEWKIDQNAIELFSINWNSGSERGRGKAKIPFGNNLSSVLDLQFEGSDLGTYFPLMGDTFRHWKGVASGNLHFDGPIAKEISGALSFMADIVDFDIRSYSSDRSIFYIPALKASGSGRLDKISKGEVNFNLNINENVWNGRFKWSDERLDLTWTNKLNGQLIGKLFGYTVAAAGEMPGSFAGQWGQLQMLARPALDTLKLNQEQIRNLTGNFRYVNHRLLADPLVADELSVSGGIYFPSNAPETFDDFQFKVRDLDLREFFGYLHFTPEDIWNAQGILSGEGFLSGRLDKPQGSGSLAVDSWRFGNNGAKGHRASARWAWAAKEFYLTDMLILLTPRESGLRGDLTIDNHGVADVSLNAERLRLSDWSYLVGLDVRIQSLASLDFSYQRDTPSLIARMETSETSFGGDPQPPSLFSFSWVKDRIEGDLNLFNGALEARLGSNRSADVQTTNLDFKIKQLNMTPWIGFLSSSRLETLVNASGALKAESRTARQSMLSGLIDQWRQLSGEVNVQSAEVKRTALVLQQIRPFRVRVKPGQTSWLRFESDQILIQSGEGRRLSLKGYYEDLDKFAVDVSGKTDLRAISGMSPTLSRSEGVLEVDGIFRPDGFTGKLNLTKGMVTFQDSPLVIRNVEASVRSEQSDFEIVNFSGSLREGGLTAKGRVKLNSRGAESARILVELSNTLFQPQDGVSLRASGPLELKVVQADGEITGKLQIYDGLFRRRVDLRSDIVRLFNNKRIDLKVGDSQDRPWKNWRLKIAVDSSDPFTIRNNLAEGGANLHLVIAGTIRQPRILGNIDIVRGQFSFNNRQFVVRSGSVVFQNPNTNIPNYDIRAETEIGDYRVFVKLLGGPDEQKISYTSEPALNEKDILSVISFGLPSSADELRSQDQTRTMSFTGISFVTGQIQDQIESRLSKDLGVQRFSLGPAFFEETGKTELQMTVGTDLVKNKLAVNYSQFLSAAGGHKVELDFKVNRNFSLIGSWRDVREEGKSSDDFGGDLRFRFEIE